jgi:endonuclease YncB( thermonuclease family)
VVAIAVGALSQGDLSYPEVWRTVEAPIDAVYPVLTLTRIIDGDTFEAWLHIAPRFAYFADVRVAGVDTPEIRGDCKIEGFRVKAAVEEFLFSAYKITVKVVDVDSFGRWVCDVTVTMLLPGLALVHQDLADWIREQGFTKEELCPG